MTKAEIKRRLAAIKYVQNTKTGNWAVLKEETANGCYCRPLNATKVIFWKNYKHVEAA